MFPDISFLGESVLQTKNYGHIYSLDKELSQSSLYIRNLTRGLVASHKRGRKSHQNNKRHSLDILQQSLDVIDTDSFSSHLSASNSLNNTIDIVREEEEEKNEVGRVAGWAVNFDKLLQDTSGLCIFTEFLKKEFSEENIIFWMTVQQYKQITSQEMRNEQAKEIFNKHLSVHALEPVNIDSVARQQADSELDIPSPQIFDLAQQQIYRLMKQDSYARFLKSELYKNCLLKEMEGKPLDIKRDENKNRKITDENVKDYKMKTDEEVIEGTEKRRRSLLPWRYKNSQGSMKSSSYTGAKISKNREKKKEKEPKNLSINTALFGSKEAIVKKQVLFWLDLPNKKSVEVKAKPTRGIRVVLKPILHKYGLRMDDLDIYLYLPDDTVLIDLEGLVSSLDNQRVLVVSKDDCPRYQRRRSSLFVFIEKRIQRNCDKGSSREKEATNSHIFIAERQS